LLAPYPNPSSRIARFAFALPRASRVQLRVLDVAGRTVRTLADDEFVAGRHESSWDGVTDGGAPALSGVYFLELTAGHERSSRRLAWMK
jgi:flagellar hook assembly protein FlgD